MKASIMELITELEAENEFLNRRLYIYGKLLTRQREIEEKELHLLVEYVEEV